MFKTFTIWYRALPARKQRAFRMFLWGAVLLFVGGVGFVWSGSTQHGWFK